MINWEKFLFTPQSALGHFPLTFLCSEISGGTLHLSVPLVQPSPTDEQCDGQIVMVLTFWYRKHRSTSKNQVHFTLHIFELPRYIFTT